MLAVDGQAPEEIRVIRFCNALAESGIPLFEREQLRVLVDGVGQGADIVLVVIIPGE